MRKQNELLIEEVIFGKNYFTLQLSGKNRTLRVVTGVKEGIRLDENHEGTISFIFDTAKHEPNIELYTFCFYQGDKVIAIGWEWYDRLKNSFVPIKRNGRTVYKFNANKVLRPMRELMALVPDLKWN